MANDRQLRPSDTEMLDWLEEHIVMLHDYDGWTCKKSANGYELSFPQPKSVMTKLEDGTEVEVVPTDIDIKSTVREAITAVMKREL